jgi:5-formyltetrahydrofolate cyclo-ligase
LNSKSEIRNRIWRLLEEKGVTLFPKPVAGRIPNFVGARRAAELLRDLPEYKDAKTIFSNPDSPQRPIREFALLDGKIVVMASPRLKNGFILIDPRKIEKEKLREAATIRGALNLGEPADLSKVKIDLFIAGSVAVDRNGIRLGKGSGYSDQEYAILKKYNSILKKTPIITTVHDLQIVNDLPKEEWDIPVDIIITPTKIIKVQGKLSNQKYM